jgi:hypothetical protein
MGLSPKATKWPRYLNIVHESKKTARGIAICTLKAIEGYAEQKNKQLTGADKDKKKATYALEKNT